LKEVVQNRFWETLLWWNTTLKHVFKNVYTYVIFNVNKFYINLLLFINVW